MEYAAFLSVCIEHPSTNFALWQILPSAASEYFLAQQRLRLKLSGGCLTIWGEAAYAPPPCEMERTDANSSQFLECYLFCSDPYFIRASDVPVFAPGRELLLFHIADEGEKEAIPQVIAYSPERRKEVADGRKKYFGSAFGQPPVAVLRMPLANRSKPACLRFSILPRRVFWVYTISPKPGFLLHLQSTHVFRPMPTASEDCAAFISQAPLPLVRRMAEGVDLMMEDGQGQLLPLLENLAVPQLNQLNWNADLQQYTGTVHVDLSYFGIIS
ncbi:hypothetical protein [Desulfovibrio cuneatus]|uniref:hypothetical protein n=1 Tax=Desulfovibrio cuneatus TaxID=159728 RepID=UPI00041F17F7|nr:hypothetical protein [Desulfovibrio cuneatus]